MCASLILRTTADTKVTDITGWFLVCFINLHPVFVGYHNGWRCGQNINTMAALSLHWWKTGGIPTTAVDFWFPAGRVCKLHKFSHCPVIPNLMLLWCVFPMASPNSDTAEPDVSFYVATDHRKEKNKTNVQKIWQVTAWVQNFVMLSLWASY